MDRASPSRSVKILLASSSPRRHRLMTQLGVEFDVRAPDIDESVHDGEAPRRYVVRLAQEKSAAVEAGDDVLVIAADTTVELDGRVLGKPTDAADARRMLRDLSGRTHHVHSGVAVRVGERAAAGLETTLVTMVPIGAAAIDWYVGTGEAVDAAGSYALQGAGGIFVERVQGSVSNIVGLPMTLLARLCAEVGRPLVPR